MSDDPQVPPGRSGEHVDEVEVVVLGTDPVALSIAARLVRYVGNDQLRVVDREPWLSADTERVERLELARFDSQSPLADALRMITASRDPSHDGIPPDARQALEVCRRGAEELGLDACWQPGRLRWLIPVDGGRSTVVQLTDGSQVRARHVVLTSGLQHRIIPHWVHDLLPQPVDRLVHVDDVDLRSLDLRGEQVVVVGAHLSMHLATAALRRGARRVEVISEEAVSAHGFGGGDDATCAAAAAATPFLHDGRLGLRSSTRIIAAARSGQRNELMLGDERRIHADRVWLATGTRADLVADRRLRFVRELLPTPDEHPVPLDDRLRWPGSSIHVIGSALLAPSSNAPLQHPPTAHSRAVARSAPDATQLVVRSIEASLGVGGSQVGR